MSAGERGEQERKFLDITCDFRTKSRFFRPSYWRITWFQTDFAGKFWLSILGFVAAFIVGAIAILLYVMIYQ